MTKTVEEHAARFTEQAASYDADKRPEYHACCSLVVDHADPSAEDRVLDLGTGTGAIALAVPPDAADVVGRDISEGMLEQAIEKATDGGYENVDFDQGRFREPNVEGRVDIVTSNFALHHLDDDAKREAIHTIADLEPRRFVLGDVMLFADADPDDPFYTPGVDDPATVGALADMFTDAGFALTAVERVHQQVGVLVGQRVAGDHDQATETSL